MAVWTPGDATRPGGLEGAQVDAFLDRTERIGDPHQWGVRRGRIDFADDRDPAIGQLELGAHGYGVTTSWKASTTPELKLRPAPSAVTATPTCAGSAGLYGRWLTTAS